MINKIKSFINDNKLLKANSKVVLAFSYGVDSRVLLDVLMRLGYEVVLAHVNHHHREQSKLEEQASKDLAKKYNLAIHILDLKEDFSKNFHDDAHHKRYQFFIDVAKKENTTYIVTAHHQNDNLETILLNLIKGSNLYGYSGIAKEVLLDNYTLIRPLLSVSKSEIRDYAKANNIEFYEDSSNDEDEFRRNRIRHHVVPTLLNENPNLFSNVSHYSSILSDAFSFIRGKSIELVTLWQNKINVLEYKALHKALRTDIISFILEEKEISRSFNLIELIDKVLTSIDPQADVTLNNGFVFKKRYNDAFIDKITTSSEEMYELYENNVIYTKNMRFYFTKILPTLGAKYIKLCYNDLVYPLVLRTRKTGDTIKMTYGHKKIKDLLMDLHLPIEERNSTLLLLNKDRIIWVCDYAKGEELLAMKDKADIYLVYEVQNER